MSSELLSRWTVDMHSYIYVPKVIQDPSRSRTKTVRKKRKIRAIQQTNIILFDLIRIGETGFRIIWYFYDFFSCRAGAQSAGPHGSAGSGQRVQAGGNFDEILWKNMTKRIILPFAKLQYRSWFLIFLLMRIMFLFLLTLIFIRYRYLYSILVTVLFF